MLGHFERCQCNLRQAIFVRDLAFCDRETKQESMKQFGYVCKLPCQKTFVGSFLFAFTLSNIFLARHSYRTSKMSSFWEALELLKTADTRRLADVT